MASSPAAGANAAQHRPDPLPSLEDGPSLAVLDLAAGPTAPGHARAWTRRVLREWQLTSMQESVELVVSELSTNAVVASRPLASPVIRLTLIRDKDELAILVRDYGPGTPQPANVSDQDEDGRGLLLVEAMSTRWGWYPPEDGDPGKIVWAVCDAACG
jgi:anti-sigma regulatory factor (Ser/Thr protein kinase)